MFWLHLTSSEHKFLSSSSFAIFVDRIFSYYDVFIFIYLAQKVDCNRGHTQANWNGNVNFILNINKLNTYRLGFIIGFTVKLTNEIVINLLQKRNWKRIQLSPGKRTPMVLCCWHVSGWAVSLFYSNQHVTP